MPNSQNKENLTLRSVLRASPGLAPEDSLERFIQLTRFEPYNSLPVLRDGIYLGMISQEDFLPTLALKNTQDRETALSQPVSQLFRSDLPCIRPNTGLLEVGELFSETGLLTLPVVDENGWCYGIVNAGDLLVPTLPKAVPQQIGGMATPFGVYLTDGNLQAGVGDRALMASGLLMATLFILSFVVVQGGTAGVLSLLHQSALANQLLNEDSVPKTPAIAYASIGISILNTVVFLGLMRLSPLAGFHSAEHQTVHAIERGERLETEIVSRMPRAHPRCGTNLIAAMFVFFTTRQIFENIPYLSGGIAAFGDILAGMTTLFTWRKAGTFLQERFTTKPASQREILSGISAGAELMEKYRNQPPLRSSFWRKIWCMGMVQATIGSIPAYALFMFLWERCQHMLVR